MVPQMGTSYLFRNLTPNKNWCVQHIQCSYKLMYSDKYK